mmetsp:Transcript_43101/g.80199  ORF Transcript_43101/g.80199 Transcript_43101/m.80199 type:complete len:324 (-) Transcript_43101:13-984(-)
MRRGKLRWVASLCLGMAAVKMRDVSGRSIDEFPIEVRRRNTLRISREACSECMTLDAFLEAHRLGFVIFFERSLMGQHKYKGAIVESFFSACESLRWSRVTCGAVDMVSDKVYAEKFIDPKTAPAHIIFRDGSPMPMQKHHIDKLLAKPGDKDIKLWLLRDILVEEGSLEISSETADKEDLSLLIKRHEVAVVGFAQQKLQGEALRASAQAAVLRGEVPEALSGSVPVQPPKRRKRRKAPQRAPRPRLKFAVAPAASAATYGLEPGHLAAFVGGQLHPGHEVLPAAGSDAEMSKVLKKVLEGAASAKLSTAPGTSTATTAGEL